MGNEKFVSIDLIFFFNRIRMKIILNKQCKIRIEITYPKPAPLPSLLIYEEEILLLLLLKYKT